MIYGVPKEKEVAIKDTVKSFCWREKRAVYSFTCACCGKTFTAYGNSKRKYCSHECYIRNRFKGGDADG